MIFQTRGFIKGFSRGILYSSLIILPLFAPLFFIIISQDRLPSSLQDHQVETTRDVMKEDFSRFRPKKVFSVGLYIDDIGNIRVNQRLFHSRFILWGKNFFNVSTSDERALIYENEFRIVNNADLKLEQKALRLITELPIENKKSEEKADAPLPILYVSYEGQGDLKNEFYLKNYPFDIQTLKFIVEPRHYNAQEMLLTVDPHSALAGKINLGEWQVVSFIAHGDTQTTQSDYSDPALVEKGALWNFTPQVTFEIKIKRHLLSQLLKFLLPLMIIMLIAYSNYFVDPSRFDARFGISITAILSITALHLSAVSQLPGVSYLTAMDQFFLCAYSLILLVGIESVVSSRILPDEDAPVAEWEQAYQHRWICWGLPLLRIAYPLFLFGGWYWIAWRAMQN